MKKNTVFWQAVLGQPWCVCVCVSQETTFHVILEGFGLQSLSWHIILFLYKSFPLFTKHLRIQVNDILQRKYIYNGLERLKNLQVMTLLLFFAWTVPLNITGFGLK